MSVRGLPSSTEIRKPVHKKLLYAKFSAELSGERRKQFDEDIGRIIVTNEISPVSVNIKEGKEVKAIFVLQVELKNKAYNERNIVLISKLFGQHLLIALKYADEVQLAIYQTRLLHSEWMAVDEAGVKITGLDLDGNQIKIRAREDLAIAFQHEIDHLDGILFYDRINKKKPFFNENEIRLI